METHAYRCLCFLQQQEHLWDTEMLCRQERELDIRLADIMLANQRQIQLVERVNWLKEGF